MLTRRTLFRRAAAGLLAGVAAVYFPKVLETPRLTTTEWTWQILADRCSCTVLRKLVQVDTLP